MDNKAKKLGLLGILFRANKVLIGSNAKYGAQKAYFGFLAYDASDNTKKDASKIAIKYNLELSEEFSKEELGKALGYGEVSLALITDKKASNKLNDN